MLILNLYILSSSILLFQTRFCRENMSLPRIDTVRPKSFTIGGDFSRGVERGYDSFSILLLVSVATGLPNRNNATDATVCSPTSEAVILRDGRGSIIARNIVSLITPRHLNIMHDRTQSVKCHRSRRYRRSARLCKPGISGNVCARRLINHSNIVILCWLCRYTSNGARSILYFMYWPVKSLIGSRPVCRWAKWVWGLGKVSLPRSHSSCRR